MYTMPFWLKKHRLHFLFPPATPKKGNDTWVAPKLAKSPLGLEDEACGGLCRPCYIWSFSLGVVMGFSCSWDFDKFKASPELS